LNGLSGAPAPDGPRLMQPEGDSSARRAKENQAKILGFAWFYLVESSLFKGLRAKK
jgi:hypothetical protein